MKIIIISFLLTVSLLQTAVAVQTCKGYIPDQWPDSRYTVEILSGDNVVIDKQTGLMWKQCSQGLTGVGCFTGALTVHTWQQALDIADTEDFAGFSDWRVPNHKELRTIVANNCYIPSINKTIFPNTASNWFWSSSPIAGNEGYSWAILFGDGEDFSHNRDNEDSHVRLVRSPEQ